MYVTPSNITGIIDRLEKKGLVERIRQQGDRRVALITLTQSGQKLGQTIPDPIEKNCQLIYKRIKKDLPQEAALSPIKI